MSISIIETDQGVFFSLIKNAPDTETVEQYCKAFPEFAWTSDSIYWLNLIRERYGKEKIPDFKKMFLKMIEGESRVGRIKAGKSTLRIAVRRDNIDFLFSVVDANFKERCQALINIGKMTPIDLWSQVIVDVDYVGDSFILSYFTHFDINSKISESRLLELISLIPADDLKEVDIL